MPAYNVGNLIGKTIERIPPGIWKKITRLVIINDGSIDNTLEVARKLFKIFPRIHIINKVTNEGFARALKTGFEFVLGKSADILVLLHSDGQYAPEEMDFLLKPIEAGEADIVQGSRILGGGALRGGMPLYKYIANRILSKLENWAAGMNLAEFHSGYIIYSGKALQKIPYKKLSNSFHFDGETLLVGHKLGLRILELPVSTHYGSEKSHVKLIPFGFAVLKIILDYKRNRYGF